MSQASSSKPTSFTAVDTLSRADFDAVALCDGVVHPMIDAIRTQIAHLKTGPVTLKVTVEFTVEP